jgi:hypothetical protein
MAILAEAQVFFFAYGIWLLKKKTCASARMGIKE